MMSSNIIKSISFFLLFVSLIVISGCQKKIVFPEISCDDTYALKKTGRLRGDNGWSSFYPECDLSQIDKLPVYRNVADYDVLKEIAIDNAQKLSVNLSALSENIDPQKSGDETMCVYSGKTNTFYISDDGDFLYYETSTRIAVSGHKFVMHIKTDSNEDLDIFDTSLGEFPTTVDYDLKDGELILSEKNIRLYTDKCNEYLKMLKKEDYVLHNIQTDYHKRFSNYIVTDYPDITIKLKYFPPRVHEYASDILLDYYELNSCVELIISYYINPSPNYGDILSCEISLCIIDTDWMNNIGEYNIIPISKANSMFDNNDNVSYYKEFSPDENEYLSEFKNYNIYLVYVEDNEGYIRPIYMKQDYYSVGNLYRSAWVDAINY